MSVYFIHQNEKINKDNYYFCTNGRKLKFYRKYIKYAILHGNQYDYYDNKLWYHWKSYNGKQQGFQIKYKIN